MSFLYVVKQTCRTKKSELTFEEQSHSGTTGRVESVFQCPDNMACLPMEYCPDIDMPYVSVQKWSLVVRHI